MTSTTRRTHRSNPAGLWFALLALVSILSAVALAPGAALARSYEVDGVVIDATVGTDGTLDVVEERSYAFAGSFDGIYWDVPRASFEGRAIDADILSVGAIDDGVLREFSQVKAGGTAEAAPGTYELSNEADCYRLKLNWPAKDRTVTFHVAYRMPDLASRWADTSELYWQYVPADESSEAEWRNVTTTVHLPVPAGERVIPGENVRAWGHGPLDGEVSFAGEDVVFSSPGVGSAEFLEARIAFPAAWLADTPSLDRLHLDAILAEEDAWAQEANAQRLRTRMIDYGIPGCMLLVAVATFLLAFAHAKGFHPFKKEPTASFADQYFRDVPSDDHPAVLGMLYHDGELTGAEFSATLMRLADEGRVSLDAVWCMRKNRCGELKRVRDWRLMDRPSEGDARASTLDDVRAGSSIDGGAHAFLFETIAVQQGQEYGYVGPAGEAYVLASSFERVAKEHPHQYNEGIRTWSDAVRSAYGSREFESRKKAFGEGIYPGILGIFDFAAATVLGLVGSLLQVPTGLLAVTVILLFAAGIYCVMNNDERSETTVAYSQEALELRAKLVALKRWFEDFTRLEEAIPTDVVLWNRLLVMATVLGVSKQVVAALRARVPALFSDPNFVATTWYEEDEEREDDLMPALLLARCVRTQVKEPATSEKTSSSGGSHHASRSSSTRNSSSRGSGGGSSGGGGGGHHGGGRGGAF